MSRLQKAVLIASLFAVAAIGLVAAGVADRWFEANPPRHLDGLPGEFESHEALLLGWETLSKNAATSAVQQRQQRVLVEIARSVADRIKVVLLVESAHEEKLAGEAMRAAGVPEAAVEFVRLPFNSMWTQDYGPLVVRQGEQQEWIDCRYFPSGHNRPKDELLPSRLAQLHQVKVEELPIVVHGGLLLSNGQGLYLTTTEIYKWNMHLKRADLDRMLAERLRAQRIEVLETLADEPTGHVDIFATFTDPNTVVVGQFTKQQDPKNAKILDATARRLARVRTANGRLRVVRIPMPPRGVEVWGGTYTNVVYANGVLLMPTYGFDREGEEKAKAVYRRLLPDWQIVGINSRALIVEEGALHCAVKHLLTFDSQLQLTRAVGTQSGSASAVPQ